MQRDSRLFQLDFSSRSQWKPPGWVTRAARCWIASSRDPTVRAHREMTLVDIRFAPFANCRQVNRDEVDRLRKRFMKLDKVRVPPSSPPLSAVLELMARASGQFGHHRARRIPQPSPDRVEPPCNKVCPVAFPPPSSRQKGLFLTGVVVYRLIAIFDEDGGGDVDFQEFVSGLSAFSSKGNKEQKLRFAFKVYDIDRDGFISNGELFIVLKMMVGSNLKDQQLQQIVDKTIMEADLDGDGKINFEEFTKMVENTDVSMSMTLGIPSERGGHILVAGADSTTDNF